MNHSPEQAATRAESNRVRRTLNALICSGVLAATALGCDQLERFDNSDGSAFCGPVIFGSFVRQGFYPEARLQLQLDLAQLETVPGKITLDGDSDGPCFPRSRFDEAPLRVSQKLLADPLSALEFGESQEKNLLTWVDSACDGTYLAVLSLMRDETVEVRLTRGELGDEGQEAGPFGVFHLRKHDSTCGY